MLSRNRCIFAAVCGLLLASGSSASEQRSSTGGSNYKQIAERLERIDQSIRKSNAPDPGCQPTAPNRQSDLCAQWKAADAGQQAANAADRATFQNWLSILLGAATLASAVAAALYAKRAALATEATVKIAEESAQSALDSIDLSRKSVSAAVRQTEISEQAAEDRNRPYLIFEGVDISPVSDLHIISVANGETVEQYHERGYMLSLTFRNVGLTPAINVFAHRADRTIVDNLYNIPLFDHDVKESRAGAVVGPTKTVIAKPNGVGQAELHELQISKQWIILHAICTYSSIQNSNSTYETQITLAITINGSEKISGGVLSPNFVTEIVGKQNTMI